MHRVVSSSSGSSSQSVSQAPAAPGGPLKQWHGPVSQDALVKTGSEGRLIVLHPRVAGGLPAPDSPEWQALGMAYEVGSAKSSAKRYLDQKKISPALIAAETAVLLSQQRDAEALLIRGEVRLMSGNPWDALDDFSASLRLDPQVKEARRARAQLLEDLARQDLKMLNEAAGILRETV